MKFLLLVVLIPLNLYSAAFNFKGDYRGELALYHDLDLQKGLHGTADAGQGSSDSKEYMMQRFRLKPELFVDDNLRIKSTWNVWAGAPITTTNMGGEVNGINSGALAGNDNKNFNIALSRAWLEWISDWGVLSVGRQGFQFGLGMLYNAGNDVWSYYGSTVDRMMYDLRLGNLAFKAGYDLVNEGAVNNSADDADAFFLEIDYLKPENDTEMGLIWYKELATFGKSMSTFDIYQKKKFPQYNMDLGWELAYKKGSERGETGIDSRSKVKTFGGLFDINWSPSVFKLGFKAGLATGDNNISDNRVNGFAFNKAYKIGLLLFNEDLGIGGNGVHSSNGIGADFNGLGAFFFNPNFLVKLMEEKLNLTVNYIYATTQKKNTSSKSSLGNELDFGGSYFFKENVETGLDLGFFFPGAAAQGKTVAYGMVAKIGFKF